MNQVPQKVSCDINESSINIVSIYENDKPDKQKISFSSNESEI